jgi:hypothetical protein|tara:strand:- start:641 stop:856 length:216 start_codon:yes stop_codon:yes gene_type:complete
VYAAIVGTGVAAEFATPPVYPRVAEFEGKMTVPPAVFANRLDPKFRGASSDKDMATKRVALAPVALTVPTD